MIRTQIQLTREQSDRLREIAREQGISLAEAIRRCIERALPELPAGRADRYARAAKLVGALRDPEGVKDLASDHDRYLGDSFA
jgi:hypothetical protein